MDIVVYTNERTLEHKREPDTYNYWQFSQMPLDVKKGDRIFFAAKGRVRGSFLIEDVMRRSWGAGTVRWFSNTWKKPRRVIEHRPFRSFRYRWW